MPPKLFLQHPGHAEVLGARQRLSRSCPGVTAHACADNRARQASAAPGGGDRPGPLAWVAASALPPGPQQGAHMPASVHTDCKHAVRDAAVVLRCSISMPARVGSAQTSPCFSWTGIETGGCSQHVAPRSHRCSGTRLLSIRLSLVWKQPTSCLSHCKKLVCQDARVLPAAASTCINQPACGSSMLLDGQA